MRLGKVIGNIVSTIKDDTLYGIKLMVVRPIDPDGKPIGTPEIVGDYLNSAIGNLVYWTEDGTAICKAFGKSNIPLRGCIIGIVDKVDQKDKKKVLDGEA